MKTLWASKKIALLVASSYVGLFFLAAIHLGSMHTGTMPMQGCPFSFGQHAMCQMNLVEHLQSLQQLSTLIIPSPINVLIAIVIFVLPLTISKGVLKKLIVLKRVY